MNWQALNPLRWASASKNGVAALWRRRPQLTRRRVAWGTAATMLLSGSSYYGYQKLQPDRTVARSAGAPGSVGEAASLVGTIQPIPDGGDPGVIPPAGPAPGSYGDPNATDPATGAAENGQGGAFGAGPPAAAYPASDSSVESHAVQGGEGSVAQETGDTGQPEAGNPAAGDASEDGRGRVIAMNEGPIQMAVEAQPEGGENPGEVAPAADSGPPPPATFAAENPSPVPGGPPGQFPAPSTATPTAPDTTSADLVPVPSRPQPAPPEEHVRLPAEAVPNLSPRDGVGGGRGGGEPRGEPAIPTPPPSFTGVPSAPSAASGLPPRDFSPPRANAGFASPDPATPMEPVGAATIPMAASAAPGAKHLEGPQAPSLELEKIAPAEVQVGRPARFEIKVRNVGRVAAQHITVIDQVPHGTRLLEANPPCARNADGTLRWQLGALGPGQETSIVLQLLPEQEGEIGSVAQVIFHSQAAMRTVSTRPQITIEHQVAEQALIGDQVKLLLAITNRGSGATANLVLEATLPEGLAHPAGAELEYPIGALRPGETKRIDLSLKAQRPGAAPFLFVAREESQTLAEDRASLDVLAPQLQIGVNGPKVRYLDRQATYSVAVANPGTAPATNLEIAAYLPRGLKFVSADNQGQYDPQRHAVLWGLAELPAGVMGASQLVVVPTEPGEQRIRVEGKADLKLEHAFEQPVLVETLSELQFSVVDTADPIEVGSETTYEIRLQNRGSRAASQVRVAVEFPQELTPVAGEGPTAVGVRGQQLIIEPLPRLAPNSQVAYQIRAKGVRKGDPRIRVLVASDESPTPVTKEESTRVYADE